MNIKTYTTITDLIAHEIVDVTEDLEIDIPEVVDHMTREGLIGYNEYTRQFYIVVDENGNTPGYWDIINQHIEG